MDLDQPSCTQDLPNADQVGDYGEQAVKRKLYTKEVLQMWNLCRLIRKLKTREQQICFAVEQGLIVGSKLCRYHRTPMSVDLTSNNTVGQFRCARNPCKNNTRTSRTVDTWFENVKLSFMHIYYLMYCFAHHWTYDQAIHEDPLKDEQKTCLSRATISSWYSYCREAVVSYQLDQVEEKRKIGGVGKTVRIEECKFRERKSNKGQRLEGSWLLGIIEEGSDDLRLEVCPADISEEVLIPIIQKHLETGTTISTGFWSAYDCLDRYGYIHKITINSDPDNPCDTDGGNHAERIDSRCRELKSQWREVKHFFYKEYFNHPDDFADIVVEYLWRRNNSKCRRDPFMELFKAVRHVYNVIKTK